MTSIPFILLEAMTNLSYTFLNHQCRQFLVQYIFNNFQSKYYNGLEWSGWRSWLDYGECAFGIEVCRNNAQRVMFGDYGFVHTTLDGGNNWRQAYTHTDDQHPAGSNTPPLQNYSSVGLENTSCWQVFWSNAETMWPYYSRISEACEV